MGASMCQCQKDEAQEVSLIQSPRPEAEYMPQSRSDMMQVTSEDAVKAEQKDAGDVFDGQWIREDNRQPIGSIINRSVNWDSGYNTPPSTLSVEPGGAILMDLFGNTH